MRQHLEHHLVGLAAHRRDRRIAAVERVTLAVVALQPDAQAQQVVQEQGVGFDQHRLAFRVRLARYRRGGNQAGRETGLHRATFGRTGGSPELGVARDQLHLVVHAAKLHQLLAAVAPVGADHRATEEPGFTDALGDLRRQQHGFAETLRRELDPDLFVLLPGGQEAVLLLGVLDHSGEGLRLAGRRRCRGGRGARRGSGRCAGRRRGARSGGCAAGRGGADRRGAGRRHRRDSACGEQARGRHAQENSEIDDAGGCHGVLRLLATGGRARWT